MITDRELADLLILRVALKQQRESGAIDQMVYEQALIAIDTLAQDVLNHPLPSTAGTSVRDRRGNAWGLLIHLGLIPPGVPPWATLPAAQKQSATATQQLVLPLQPHPIITAPTKDSPEASGEPSSLVSISPAVPLPPMSDEIAALVHKAPKIPDTTLIPPVPMASPTAASSRLAEAAPVVTPSFQKSRDEAWQPTGPSALERVLQTVSGWPALLVPFLVQNIIWFIVGLCFVAGSTFLVSSTSGPLNTLAVSGVLLTYTLFLMWGGYQLRRARADLETSSSVLLALGVLLAPLNIASTVRLIAGAPSSLWLVIGSLTTLVDFVVLFYATMLVSGVIDRSLQRQHPHLFFGLTGVQVAAPFLSWAPSWYAVATTHAVLLGLLAYGLHVFVRDWLQSIFVDRRKIAYYAAGTLVYAAIVSFIHLTWSYQAPTPLPAGYYGPFLMIVSGLLFYVDAQLKQWAKQYAFLSRLSFVVYGVSILALLTGAFAPYARIVTLILALGVYSSVVWQYLTLPPLYLLLLCAGWLYGLLILHYLPYQWDMLASVPGLAGLFAASHWAQRRSSMTLAVHGYRVGLVTALALAGWSLGHTHPSMLAVSTALITMVITLAALFVVPPQVFAKIGPTETPGNLSHTPWAYVPLIMASVAVVYAPLWLGQSWLLQCAGGIVLLTWLWITLATRLHRTATTPATAWIPILLNSALVNLAVALFLILAHGLSHAALHRAQPLLLIAMGGAVLRMGLNLRVRWLLYGALGLWGAAGLLLKLLYFPQPSSGLVVMILSLAAWGLLWWLENEPDDVATLRREQLALQAAQQPPFTLLWVFPVHSERTYADLLRLPLQQSMIALGMLGLLQLSLRLFSGALSWAWVASAGLGALVATVATGYFRVSSLFPLALVLGLGAWQVSLSQVGLSTLPALSCAGAVYALVVWQTFILLRAQPQVALLARQLRLGGSQAFKENWVHRTSLTVTLACIVAPLVDAGVFAPSLFLLITLTTSLIFFARAGWHHQTQLHSYLLLATTLLGVFLLYAWQTFPSPHDSLHALLHASALGFIAATAGLVFWLLAWEVKSRTNQQPQTWLITSRDLYYEPLCTVTLVVAVFAITQQLILGWASSQAIAPLTIVTLLFASAVLFLGSSTFDLLSVQVASLLFVSLAVVWAEGALVHPTSTVTLWPGGASTADQWFTLSLLALGFAVGAHRLRHGHSEAQPYAPPVRCAAALTYAWALAGVAVLFLDAPLRGNLGLALAIVVLAFCLFPLVQPLSRAAQLRGAILPLFASAVLYNLLGLAELSAHLLNFTLTWGVLLWMVGNFIVPRWNERQPQWTIAAETWPWFGLLAIGSCVLTSFLSAPHFSRSALLAHAGYLTVGALYALLMSRNSAWFGFPWIAALLFTQVGSALNSWGIQHPRIADNERVAAYRPLLRQLGVLLWLNLMILVVPWWRAEGDLWAKWLRWRTSDPTPPFLLVPAFFLLWLLSQVGIAILTYGGLGVASPTATTWLATGLVSVLLIFSFLHVWWWHRAPWEPHALLVALLYALMSLWLAYGTPFFYLPLFFALWSAGLRFSSAVWEQHQWGGETFRPLRQALSLWLEPSLVVAIAIFFLLFDTPRSERLLTLAILIDTAAVLGWQRQQQRWLVVTWGMLLVLLHDWPLLWVPMSQASLLLPWYALQLTVFAWALLWWERHLLTQQPPTATKNPSSEALPTDAGHSLLWWAWPLTAGVAVVEWCGHGWVVVSTLASTSQFQWLIPPYDACAALAAVSFLVVLGTRQVRISQSEWWTYGVLILAGLAGVYIRLLINGLAPATMWDTAALIATTYALFILYRLVPLEPIFRAVMVVPFLTLLTVPLQLASSQTGATFLSAAVLYLWTAYGTERRAPIYLALLALNAAVYLWVPLWATHYHIVQLYVTPLALSVLLLAHVHRNDVSPKVLNSVRLAAMSVLYVSATSDVFLRPGLTIFVVALLLSLVGVGLGIAYRIRAFLYSGIASLVINIGWQLLMLFPEQRFGQAIILLTLAAVLAGAMIWFNAQRKAILQRVRIFRADLETWK
ncbi:MAG: hypothetical protein AB7G75_19875 [Candidatus Binatia bacterium]